MHVVQRHGLGGILNQIRNIVHGVDQGMNLLPVNGRNESDVDCLVHIVCHPIGSTLRVIYILVVLLTQMGVAVIGYQFGKRMGCINNTIRMLIEHFEKIAFARQQLAKKHGGLLKLAERDADNINAARSLTAQATGIAH
jgi:hypothetical protein